MNPKDKAAREAELKAAVDRAWADLNSLGRELLDCSHVRRWRRRRQYQARLCHYRQRGYLLI